MNPARAPGRGEQPGNPAQRSEMMNAGRRALRPGHDHFVVIPMPGPHVSLNVAMALGIALYEWRRQCPPPVFSEVRADGELG